MIKRVLGFALLWALLSGFTFPVIQLQAKPGSESIGFENVGIRLEAREDYEVVPLKWVEHALRHHSYPYDLEAILGPDFPIYLTDMQILSRSTEAVAVTIGGGLILFSGAKDPTRANVEETLLHEIAHALAARTMNDERWAAYRKIRGLGPEYRESGLWHRRPGEVFAEDFAHLFGTFHARQAEWPFADLPEAGTVPGLQEFFVGLFDDSAPRRLVREASVFQWMRDLAQVPGYPAFPPALPWEREGNGTLTKAQAAYLLSRALPGKPGNRTISRADAPTWPAWAVGAIEQVQAHGILPALPDGRFEPNRFLTEQEAALAIQQLRLVRSVRSGASRGAGKIMFR